MTYILNVEYLKTQKSADSELIKALARYEGVLPLQLYYAFNPYRDEWGIPQYIRDCLYEIHGNNWVEHGRYGAFIIPGESWGECEDRLSKMLLDEINLPILIEVR